MPAPIGYENLNPEAQGAIMEKYNALDPGMQQAMASQYRGDVTPFLDQLGFKGARPQFENLSQQSQGDLMNWYQSAPQWSQQMAANAYGKGMGLQAAVPALAMGHSPWGQMAGQMATAQQYGLPWGNPNDMSMFPRMGNPPIASGFWDNTGMLGYGQQMGPSGGPGLTTMGNAMRFSRPGGWAQRGPQWFGQGPMGGGGYGMGSMGMGQERQQGNPWGFYRG